MVEINEIASIKVGLGQGIILTLIGIIVYNLAELISSKKLKTARDFVFAIWWYDNSIKFIGSCLIISCLFWLSYSNNVLTADKALLLGIVGNLLFAKFIGWLSKDRTDGAP